MNDDEQGEKQNIDFEIHLVFIHTGSNILTCVRIEQYKGLVRIGVYASSPAAEPDRKHGFGEFGTSPSIPKNSVQ